MFHSAWVESRTDLTHTHFQQHVPVVIESSANMPHHNTFVTSANLLPCFRPAENRFLNLAVQRKVQILHEI